MQVNSLKLNLKNIKKFLRVDHDFDDEILNLYISAAEELAKNYLGEKFESLKNNPLVKTALISHIKYLYEEDEDSMLMDNVISEYRKHIQKKIY